MLLASAAASAQVLDKQKLLDAQTFWDNRDWDWYKANIPFFDSPDPDINTTYYYRWELVTKHLTYGSPDAGYVYTEFIDRPFWSGATGRSVARPATSSTRSAGCADPRLSLGLRALLVPHRRRPAAPLQHVAGRRGVGGQHACIRTTPRLRTCCRTWSRTTRAGSASTSSPRSASSGRPATTTGWSTTSTAARRRTSSAAPPGYRPTLNAYLWADARAIERVARLAGDEATAKKFAAKAAGLKENLQKKLWDPQREFFFHMYKQDETARRLHGQGASA